MNEYMNVLESFGESRSINDILDFKKIIFFGAGESSNEAFKYFNKKGKEIIAYFDSNVNLHGNKKNNIKIYNPINIKEMVEFNNAAVVITSSYQHEISIELTERYGVSQDKIFPYITEMFSKHFNPALISDNYSKIKRVNNYFGDYESINYFNSLIKFRWTMNPLFLKPNSKIKGFFQYDNSKLGPQYGDYIIDCGAYIGDTVELYINRLDRKCKIYAIEAYPPNYERLLYTIKQNKIEGNVIPLNIAVDSKPGTIKMPISDRNINPRKSIKDTSNANYFEVNVDTIDGLVEKLKIPKIDFIKMDIEGSELEALKGAANTIKKYKPSLVLSAYHVPEHIWELVDMAKKLNNNYKIFAGHHPKCIYEIEYYLYNK